jgi:hypothetical protein
MDNMASFVGDIITAIWGKVSKEAPSRSEVHVNTPLGSKTVAPKKPKKKKGKGNGEPSEVAKAMFEEEHPELADMARIVAFNDGMEVFGDQLGERHAVTKEHSEEFRGYFHQGQEFAGIDVDLACGDQREPGYIGMDLYPWDASTVVHDLNLGIPLPDGCARSLRLTGIAKGMPEVDDAASLLEEIGRVLMPCGKLIYSGEDGLPKTAWLANLGPDKEGGFTTYIRVQSLEEAKDEEDKEASDFGDGRDDMDSDGMPGLFLVNHIVKKAIDATDQEAAAKMRVARAVQKAFDPAHVVPMVGSAQWDHLAYGVILAPEEWDLQGDIIAEREIRDTAHHYLQECRIIKARHKGEPLGVEVVESYIAPQDITFDGVHGQQVAPKGSWIVGAKVNDPNVWQKVLDGEYTGFSVGGDALREEQ